MTYKLITINNYLLSVTQYRKRSWFYCVRTKSFFHDEGEDVLCCNGDLSVVAHLPLNGADVINDLPLLPPLEEDDAVKWARSQYSSEHGDYEEIYYLGLIKGYNKAKEKYKYTEEDLRKVVEMARDIHDYGDYNGYYWSADEIIQSLSQPKMPIGFECVMEDKIALDGHTIIGTEPITTTTPEGYTQWKGTYIYE